MVGPEAGADRGISELLGMVLLIGIVLVGSVTVVVLGSSALSDAEGDTRLQSAQNQFKAFDSKLNTLAVSEDRTRIRLDASESLASDIHVKREGSINVTVDRNVTCSFEQPLSTIRFEDSNGRSVGFEAGGVFRAGVEGSTAVSAPALSFDGGTLDLRLVNLTGQLDQISNRVDLNLTGTRSTTRSHMTALTQGECMRPDNVTIRVNSSFQSAWRNYLETELGAVGTVDSFANGTVRARLPQGALHPSADDRLNQVINLEEHLSGVNIAYMTNATLDGKMPDGPAMVNASKNSGNSYSAFIEPLTRSGIDIGREKNLAGQNITGPPIDVAIIMDESGSMRFAADGSGDCGQSWQPALGAWYYDWCPNPKLDAAISASKEFVGTLNESRDRAGIVGYNTSGYYHLVNEQYFSTDFGAVNSTLENDLTAYGGTRIDRGMEHSNSAFDFKSNQSRSRYAIMLTDGKNDCASSPCSANTATEKAAEIANERDITVYTVGYGADSFINETLLKLIANETGGKYYQATNASALEDVFADIGSDIEPQSAIASTPFTANVTSGSSVFDADIPGNTSHIASVSQGGHSFQNLNDPTAPSLFSYSFPHEDNETFSMNMSSYACEPNSWNLTSETKSVGGETLTVARCTDLSGLNRTFGADFYIDGERPETLLKTTYAGWQTDVNQSLDEFPDVSINDTTGEFEAGSNQALAVFDLPPIGDGTRNTLALLVQIGLSDEEGETDVLTVRVAETEVGS